MNNRRLDILAYSIIYSVYYDPNLVSSRTVNKLSKSVDRIDNIINQDDINFKIVDEKLDDILDCLPLIAAE